MTMSKNCFCGNKLIFEQCCQPIITGAINAQNAEVLMRSRFSAYVVGDYQYILQTYALVQRKKLTINEIKDSAQDTEWLLLQVLEHNSKQVTACVAFKAFYRIDNRYYMMHELSDFSFESGKWLYTTGVMQKGSGEFTPERNSLCLCGSGKKFKKCCAN